MTKKMIIGCTEVCIDVQPIADWMHKLHVEDPVKSIVLSFGMLDAIIMRMCKKLVREKVVSLLDPVDAELFHKRIDDFISDVMHSIAVAIYKQAKMVV